MGATISYTDNMETEKVDAITTSSDLEYSAGLIAEGQIIFVVAGPFGGLEFGVAGEIEKYGSTEVGVVQARSRSFSLGDADDGDYFDVQVCDNRLLKALTSCLLYCNNIDLP